MTARPHESPRAIVAAREAKTPLERPTDPSPGGDQFVSQPGAALLMNVGKHLVERASEVREEDAPRA
jgi:hypothetical protein